LCHGYGTGIVSRVELALGRACRGLLRGGCIRDEVSDDFRACGVMSCDQCVEHRDEFLRELKVDAFAASFFAHGSVEGFEEFVRGSVGVFIGDEDVAKAGAVLVDEGEELVFSEESDDVLGDAKEGSTGEVVSEGGVTEGVPDGVDAGVSHQNQRSGSSALV